MKANEIMECVIECLNKREDDYQNGEKVNRIKYSIEKSDVNMSVLLTILTPLDDHKSTFDDFVIGLFFHENSIRYYSRLVPLRTDIQRIDALELTNKLNRDYVEFRFVVNEIDNEGHEAIEIDRYYELQAYSTPDEWTFGIVDFAKTLDLVYYEYYDDIMKLA